MGDKYQGAKSKKAGSLLFKKRRGQAGIDFSSGSQTDPFFQNKNSGCRNCRLTGQMGNNRNQLFKK